MYPTGPGLYERADDIHAPTSLRFAAPIVARSLRKRLADLITYPILLAWVGSLIGYPLPYGAIAGLLLGLAYFFYYRPSGVVPSIEFSRETLTLPDPLGRDRSVELPYQEIVSFGLRGEDPVDVVIGTERRLFAYSTRAIGDEEQLEQLRREVLSRIARLQNGREIFQRLQDKSRVLSEVMGRPIRVTKALLLLISAVFLLELWLGALPPILDTVKALLGVGAGGESLGNIERMLRMGANAGVLVKEGQWDRLFSANFLHGGLLHIGMNGAALLALGGVMERMIGGARFLLIYLLAGVAGSLASAFYGGAPLSVGASTSLFGLLGAWLVLHLRFRALLPSSFVISGGRWLLILGINAALPIFVPVIDLWAHAGGLLAGVALGFLCYPSGETRELYTAPKPAILGALLATLLSYGLAAASTAERYLAGPILPLELQEVLQLKDPSMLNNLAWYVVSKGDSDPDTLRRAGELAEQAVERATDPTRRRAYRDTLATSYFRRGQPKRAAYLELQALAPAYEETMVSQLARFLAATVERGEPLAPDEAALPPPSAELRQDGLQVQLGLGDTKTALFLVMREGALAGLLRLSFEQPQPEQRVILSSAVRLRLGKVEALMPALVSSKLKLWPAGPQAVGLKTGGGEPVEFEFTPYSPEVGALPGATQPP